MARGRFASMTSLVLGGVLVLSYKRHSKGLPITISSFSGVSIVLDRWMMAVNLLASHQGDPGSILGRATPDFRMWESCPDDAVGRRVFSRGSPVSPALSFRCRSILVSIALVGSQDLDVKSLRVRFPLISTAAGTVSCPGRSGVEGKGRDNDVTAAASMGRLANTCQACDARPRRVWSPEGSRLTRPAPFNTPSDHTPPPTTLRPPRISSSLFVSRGGQCPSDCSSRHGKTAPSSAESYVLPTTPRLPLFSIQLNKIEIHLEEVDSEEGHGARAGSMLAAHQGDPGSIPGRVTADFRMWESCSTIPLVGGFSRGSPVSPPFHTGAAPYSSQSPSMLRVVHISSLSGQRMATTGSNQ
ncbi:hypothetical protein PR048_029507 [Dryococelus australis]|uniref:Uncharacterized protein n=1 Tax=Dryococelus australis TaxID=614101 RepID=A0ABQ9GDJ8_9NEOP|nr:hypothetical protein PR048_029507 [Dryococelus australis]